jgi:hypothetical protein
MSISPPPKAAQFQLSSLRDCREWLLRARDGTEGLRRASSRENSSICA